MDCNAGDSRPRPEYLIMKNHTKCGCRPPADDGRDQSPQRLQDMVCGGQGRRLRGSYSGGHNGANGYSGNGAYGGYGQNGQSMGYGSQYSGSQQHSYPMSAPSTTSSSPPCSNSMSSRPLVDGQMVRGTIRITVGPKGFMQNQQQNQQQPCPYG